MKLKRPNLPSREWRIQERAKSILICNDDGPPVLEVPVNYYQGPSDRQRATAKAAAALPEVMDILEGILSDAERYIGQPKKQTSALWNIEASAREALLKLGYTEAPPLTEE